MVFTRSSARKPPNPSRPSSAPSRLTSQPQPIPVHDDPPPSQPRRSRRIKQKNADNTSSQPASPDSSLTTSLIEIPQHPSLQHDEPSPPVLSEHTVDSKHSDDDAPEEIKTETVDPRIDASHRQTPQHTIKKNRRRRNRNRPKKHNSPSLLEPASLPSQHESQLQIVIPTEESSSPVTDRLSADAIADAQNALEDAKKRGYNAKQMARLENQVKHVVRLNIPQQVGRTKVALLSDTFPLIRRPAKKGRKPPASFLSSCIQKGPKRVPASKIAMMARSKRSIRP